jgi:hypothetical protein
MKKQLILVLALIALMSVFSFSITSAQDEEEELPPCDPMTAMTGLQELMEPLTDIGELTTVAGDGNPSDYSQMVADIDAYVSEYWTNFDESEFECAEEKYIAYTIGLGLDELLIVSELSALSVHEATAGNSEAATLFGEQAGARAETLTEDMTAMTDLITSMMTGEEMDMGGDLDECSEEDMTALADGIGTINETYIELGNSLTDASGNDLTAVVAGFSTLSSEYWVTFAPELPECAEAQDLGTSYGLLLDDTLIMVGLLKLAEYEAEAGNDELAQTLTYSITVRSEALTAMAEEVFGTAEEE